MHGVVIQSDCGGSSSVSVVHVRCLNSNDVVMVSEMVVLATDGIRCERCNDMLTETIEVLETINGRWMLVVNGYQRGGRVDHTLGCGTATYATPTEALADLPTASCTN